MSFPIRVLIFLCTISSCLMANHFHSEHLTNEARDTFFLSHESRMEAISSKCSRIGENLTMRVTPDQLFITDKQIFLQLDGLGLVPVSSIYRDFQGSYVCAFNIFNSWKCPDCDTWNNKLTNSYCYNCGREQPKD